MDSGLDHATQPRTLAQKPPLWLLVLTGMFSPESLIVFVMALREVDADQLAGLMRSAVHIWIALSIVLALAKLVLGLGATSSTATNQKGSQPCA